MYLDESHLDDLVLGAVFLAQVAEATLMCQSYSSQKY